MPSARREDEFTRTDGIDEVAEEMVCKDEGNRKKKKTTTTMKCKGKEEDKEEWEKILAYNCYDHRNGDDDEELTSDSSCYYETGRKGSYHRLVSKKHLEDGMSGGRRRRGDCRCGASIVDRLYRLSQLKKAGEDVEGGARDIRRDKQSKGDGDRNGGGARAALLEEMEWESAQLYAEDLSFMNRMIEASGVDKGDQDNSMITSSKGLVKRKNVLGKDEGECDVDDEEEEEEEEEEEAIVAREKREIERALIHSHEDDDGRLMCFNLCFILITNNLDKYYPDGPYSTLLRRLMNENVDYLNRAFKMKNQEELKFVPRGGDYSFHAAIGNPNFHFRFRNENGIDVFPITMRDEDFPLTSHDLLFPKEKIMKYMREAYPSYCWHNALNVIVQEMPNIEDLGRILGLGGLPSSRAKYLPTLPDGTPDYENHLAAEYIHISATCLGSPWRRGLHREYGYGKTLVHECGHVFDLRHPFDDAETICDSPLSTLPNHDVSLKRPFRGYSVEGQPWEIKTDPNNTFLEEYYARNFTLDAKQPCHRIVPWERAVNNSSSNNNSNHNNDNNNDNNNNNRDLEVASFTPKHLYPRLEEQSGGEGEGKDYSIRSFTLSTSVRNRRQTTKDNKGRERRGASEAFFLFMDYQPDYCSWMFTKEQVWSDLLVLFVCSFILLSLVHCVAMILLR